MAVSATNNAYPNSFPSSSLSLSSSSPSSASEFVSPSEDPPIQFLEEGVSYANQNPEIKSLISRLEKLFSISAEPVSMEIFQDLNLFQFIRLAYLKLLRLLLPEASSSDLFFSILQLLERPPFCTDEEFDFIKPQIVGAIDAISGKVSNDQTHPLHKHRADILEFNKALEQLLNFRRSYLSTLDASKDQNRLKGIKYLFGMIHEVMRSILPQIDSVVKSDFGGLIFTRDSFKEGNNRKPNTIKNTDEKVSLSRRKSYLISKWLRWLEKESRTLDSKKHSSVQIVDRFVSMIQAFESRISKELKNDLAKVHEILFSTLRLGLVIEIEDPKMEERVKELRMEIAKMVDRFFHSVADDLENLLKKTPHKVLPTELYNALCLLMMHLADESVSKNLQQKMLMFTGKAVIRRKKEKGVKGKDKKQKKLKQESAPFSLQAPSCLKLEKDLRQLVLKRSSEFFQSFHHFFHSYSYPELVDKVYICFSDQGLQIALYRTAQQLFDGVFVQGELDPKTLTIEEVIAFLRKTGTVAIKETEKDEVNLFSDYPSLINSALTISLLTQLSIEQTHNNLSAAKTLHLEIQKIFQEKLSVSLSMGCVLECYLPLLKKIRGSIESNPLSEQAADDPLWMQWIDEEDAALERQRQKKARQERKSSDIETSEEDDETPAIPIKTVYHAPEATLHCEIGSLNQVLSSTKNLITSLTKTELTEPAKRLGKLSPKDIALKQKLYALTCLENILNALQKETDPVIQGKILQDFFHFGHMFIEQGLTAHYVERYPNRIYIPHHLIELHEGLPHIPFDPRNLWVQHCSSVTTQVRYPHAFHLHPRSPLALEHIRAPSHRTLSEASPERLKQWVTDLVRHELSLLDATMDPALKPHLNSFKADFDRFCATPIPKEEPAKGKAELTAPQLEMLQQAEHTLHSSLRDLQAFIAENPALPSTQRQPLENACHHLRSLSSQPLALRQLPDQQFLLRHGHGFLIAAQYFAENFGSYLLQTKGETCFTHDLEAYFNHPDIVKLIDPKILPYILSLNVKKGSEYVVKAFANNQHNPFLHLLNELYAYSQAGENLIPAGRNKPHSHLHTELIQHLLDSSKMAQSLLTTLRKPVLVLVPVPVPDSSSSSSSSSSSAAATTSCAATSVLAQAM